MNYFRGLLLILSGAAGVVLGRWMMQEQPGNPEVRVAGSQPAAKQPANTTKSGKPTAPGTEPNFDEAVTESDLLQRWKLRDNEATLEAFVNYAQKNPARAIDMAMRLEGPGLWTFIEKLVQRMPQSGEVVMDALLRHEKFWRGSPLLDEIFTACARVNPGRAWREAQAPGAAFLPSVVDAVARGWAQKSPQEALAFAQSLPRPDHRDLVTREVLHVWSRKDSAAVMAWVKLQPGSEDLKDMIRWDQLHLDSQEDFLSMMEMVPTESLGKRFVSSFEGDGFQEVKAEDKSSSWLARLDWIAALPPGKTRSAAYAAASRYWILRDPEKVQAMLGEIVDPILRGQLQNVIAGYHTSVSLEDGLRYVETLPEGEVRESARKSLVLTWAKKDPKAATTHLLAEQKDNAWLSLVVIAQDWAALDAEAAVSFAMAHTESPAGRSMLGSAMKRWVQDDPLGASSWLSKQPTGEARDQVVAAFVSSAAQTQPEGALGWAASISDEALRRQTMQRAINTWANLDREETISWLESTPMEPALRKYLSVPLRSGSSRNPMDGFGHSSIETDSGLTLRF